MKNEETLQACYGCGALVAPVVDGPTHRYIGASAGCWALYGEAYARGFERPGFGDDRMMLLNSYCVQHPGTPSPQSIQSVCAHLIGLCVVLERGYVGRRALEAVRLAADNSDRFRWLEPPPSVYPVTIVDVRRAADPAAHAATLAGLAETTWAAWTSHQAQVRKWADDLGLK